MSKRVSKYTELIELYRSKQMNRQQLASKYNLNIYEINKILYLNGVETWDSKIRNKEEIREMIRLYVNKEMTRKEISQKYKIQLKHFTVYLYHKNIKIWDYLKPQRKKKKNQNKYFNWGDYKGHIISYYNDAIYHYNVR